MSNITNLRELKTIDHGVQFLKKMASVLSNGIDLNYKYKTIEKVDGHIKTASKTDEVNSKEIFANFPKLASELVKVADPRYSFSAGVDDFLARIIPALTVGAAIGGSKILYDKYQTSNAYSGMYNEYPELKEADPDRVRRLFHIIQTYSPNVAKDAVSSGALIKNLLEYPDAIGPNTISSLAQIEASRNKVTQAPYDTAMQTIIQDGIRQGLMPPEDEKKRAQMEFQLDNLDDLRRAGMAPPPKNP